MLPLLAEALAVVAAVEDAAHLTDEERAAKVEALLEDAIVFERRAEGKADRIGP